MCGGRGRGRARCPGQPAKPNFLFRRLNRFRSLFPFFPAPPTPTPLARTHTRRVDPALSLGRPPSRRPHRIALSPQWQTAPRRRVAWAPWRAACRATRSRRQWRRSCLRGVSGWGPACVGGRGERIPPPSQTNGRPTPPLPPLPPTGAAEDGQLVSVNHRGGKERVNGAFAADLMHDQNTHAPPPPLPPPPRQGIDSDRDAVLSPKVVEALLGTRLRGREFNRAPLVREGERERGKKGGGGTRTKPATPSPHLPPPKPPRSPAPATRSPSTRTAACWPGAGTRGPPSARPAPTAPPRASPSACPRRGPPPSSRPPWVGGTPWPWTRTARRGRGGGTSTRSAARPPPTRGATWPPPPPACPTSPLPRWRRVACTPRA